MKFKLNDRDDANNLIQLVLYTGELLMKYGAEIYRAEDTILRICKSITSSKVSIYAIPSIIFISLEFEGESITDFKRVDLYNYNLEKIDKINNFSRSFVQSNISFEESMKKLKEIDEAENLHYLKLASSAALAAAFFTLMFSGTFLDAFSSFIIGFVTIYLLDKVSKLNLTFFVNNLFGSSIVSLLAFCFVKLSLGENLSRIIIGTLMLLVPGLSTTNAIRDIMNGDFLSGIIGLTKAIFIGLAVALGVMFILKIFR